MLRGAIEVATPKRIAGWMISSAGTLSDKVVLAFSGARCVGAGSVSVFRPDLVAPDLGDGFSGFDFAIELRDGESVESVVVKLELCDAALIQAASEVVARAARPAVLTTPMHRHDAQERRGAALPLARRA